MNKKMRKYRLEPMKLFSPIKLLIYMYYNHSINHYKKEKSIANSMRQML